MEKLYTLPGYDEPVSITDEDKEIFLNLHSDAVLYEPVKQNDPAVNAEANVGSTTSTASISENGSSEYNQTDEKGNKFKQPVKDFLKEKLYGTFLGNLIMPSGKDYQNQIKANKIDNETAEETKVLMENAIRLTDDEINLASEEADNLDFTPTIKTTGGWEDSGMGTSIYKKESSTTTQPYEEIIDQAKNYLIKNNGDTSRKNIERVARLIYRDEVLENVINTKANSFFDELDNIPLQFAVKKIVGEKIIEQSYSLPEEHKKITALVDAFENQNTALNKNIESFLSAINDPDYEYTGLEEGEQMVEFGYNLQTNEPHRVPLKVVNKLNDLLTEKKLNGDVLRKRGIKFIDDTKEYEYKLKDLDLLGRDFDLANKLASTAGTSIMQLGRGIESASIDARLLINSHLFDPGAITRDRLLKERQVELDEQKSMASKYMQEEYAPDISFGNAFDSWGNFGEWSTLALAGQTGTLLMLATGRVGLLGLGISTYGTKLSDIREFDKANETRTTGLNARLSALGFGLSEVFLGAMPTFRLLNKSSKSMGENITRSFYKGKIDYIKRNVDILPAAFATEYLSEGATQLSQNIIDILAGKLQKSQVMRGVDEAAFTGGLLGPAITSVPFARGIVLSHFSDWKSTQEFRDNAVEIGKLNEAIENMDKRTTMYKYTMSEINRLTENNYNILQNIEGNLELTKDGFNNFQRVSEEQEIQRALFESYDADKTMDNSTKLGLIKGLKRKFDILEIQRQTYKQDFGILFNIVPVEEQKTWLDQAAKELGLTQGIDSDKKIKDKAVELFQKDRLEKTNNISLKALNALGKAGVNVSHQYEDSNSNLLAKVKEEIESLIEQGFYTEEDGNKLIKEITQDINSGDVNGANIVWTDKNGKINYSIYVSKTNALLNGKTEVAIHEIGHTLFIEAVKNDMMAYSVLAQEVLNYLEVNNSAMYNRIVVASNNQTPDEVLTNFLEEVSSGRFEIEANLKANPKTKGFWASIGKIIGSTTSKITNTKEALVFTGASDVVSFLATLGDKLRSGTLKMSDVKNLQKKGIAGVKPGGLNLKIKTPTVKLSVTSMSQAFDNVVKNKNFADNEDFRNRDNGKFLNEALDLVEKNQAYNSYVNGLITADINTGSLPAETRQDINRKVKEAVKDRIMLNYNPNYQGKPFSLFSFIYGNKFGKGGRTESAFKDVKKAYATTVSTIPLTNEAGGAFDVLDTSKGSDEMFDDKVKAKAKRRPRSKLGQGITLRGKKLITTENAQGLTLEQEIEVAALETFKGSMPEVESKKFKDFVLNQENKIRKSIQNRVKSTKDFQQVLKEFLPLYKNYPLSYLVQMDKRNDNKTLVTAIKQNLSSKEVDIAIKENKLPKNTSRTSGPTLYKHASPSVSQLNNFFFSNDLNPSTKGTRKDAFFRGLAAQMLFDMAPSAARASGMPSLDITKMSSTLNVEPVIKFSQSYIFDANLGGRLKVDTLLEAAKLDKTMDLGVKVLTETGRKEIVDLIKNEIIVLLPKQAWIGKQGANVFTTSGKDWGNISMTSDKVGGAALNQLRADINAMLEAQPASAFGADIKYTVEQNGKTIIKTLDSFTVSSYSTIFKDGRSEEDIKAKAKAFNDKVAIIHSALWSRINKAINKDVNKASAIATYLKLTANHTGHWHKLGAQIWGYSPNPKGIKKINKITGKVITTKREMEHAVPATAAYLYLLQVAINNSGLTNTDFKTAYDLLIKNYKLIGLDKNVETKLGKAKLARKMPKDWNILDNYWWQRYFNEAMFLQEGGIDPRSVINLDGKNMFELFKIGYDGKQTTLKLLQDGDAAAKVNLNVFGIKLSMQNNSSGQMQNLAKYDKAASLARSYSTPTKKIRVFDFDDTLAKSKSNVLYVMPNGSKGKLNATEFAKKSETLESQGAIFNFEQFNKVIDGKKGPLFELAKTMSEAKGKRDIFVLTARPQASANSIHEFLKGVGLNIPITNITGLENGSPQAKADWVINKASEGYNDFYFADDAIKNVKAVKEILSQIDVKSEVQLAKFSKMTNLDTVINNMIEKSTGIESFKEYSYSKAKRIGEKKGKYNFFIPPSAEDFAGLMYPLYGKGKQGDADMKWIKENVFDPYNQAENALTQAKTSVANDYKKLKKNFKNIPKTLKKQAFDGFTYMDAVRVSIWTAQGMEIPGLSKKDTKDLVDFIKNDSDLAIFSNELIKIQKGKPYPEPTKEWLAGTITTDIIGGINKVNRAEYLQQWQENVDILFSDKNKNKLRAAFGDGYVDALENILERMKTGSNRARSNNKIVNNITDWINNSVGAIMFFNARSAVLQTLSAVNFINFSDNNILKAGLAFANQPQYWKDFMFLMNSDYLLARRNGLKINVSESEIADAVADSKNKPKAAIAYILSKGFLPTQFADSFAIASGGATYYRNRIKKLMKDGMPQELAEQQAFLDFYAISEETQQSSRADRISMQQASTAGRVILAFANTPMQYMRLQKKAILDLKNGRGDAKTHISKIIYYGLVQNFIFNAMQNALFALIFDDDDDDSVPKKKQIRIANGMADSLLRGTGIAGAALATVKNIILKLYEESDKKNPKYEDAALELLTFSPPIDSKITKFRSALRTLNWDADEIKEKGFSLDNPAYMAGGQIISAFTNIPLDRVVRKYNNISAAMKKDTETWESMAMIAGWSEWEILGPKVKEKKKKNKVKKENPGIIF